MPAEEEIPTSGRGRIRAAATADTTVLLSGGIDSCGCVAFFLDQHRAVSAVFVDYGQLAARRERRAARRVADHYAIPLRILSIGGLGRLTSGEIQGRNAALLMASFMGSPPGTRVLAMGIHAGTPYADCSPAFSSLGQSMLDLYTGGSVQFGTPFAAWRKADIVAYCRAAKAPLHHTYSCEVGEWPPCGRCASCRDRSAYACS